MSILLALAALGTVGAAVARAAHKSAHRIRRGRTYATEGFGWVVFECSCGTFEVHVPTSCPYPQTVAGQAHREHVKDPSRVE